ncbi:hypothetical protein OG394_29245 [Kribbella sp. NBC_01245]|uniref:hypothetical protein n=1 Tax=Kribbella sp. NBC_01245 TaxID=2903578 RepID=UPI002E2E7D03|nr:hypothetical protein [Kribbella sp. NBC_01245]
MVTAPFSHLENARSRMQLALRQPWDPSAAPPREFARLFPATTQVLIRDTREQLDAIAPALSSLRNGPGWYLACQPSIPAIDLDLPPGASNLADTETSEGVLDLVSAEYDALLAESAKLACDQPARGELLDVAIQAAREQVRRLAPSMADCQHVHLMRGPFAAPLQGPFAEAWIAGLHQVDNSQASSLRRVRRLLDITGHSDKTVEAVYSAVDPGTGSPPHDQDLVVVLAPATPGAPHWAVVDWPNTNQGTDQGWTDQTVLVADSPGEHTLLLAVTPISIGRPRITPVRVNPGGRSFAFGTTSNTAISTYLNLLERVIAPIPATQLAIFTKSHRDVNHRLWQAISTTTGPLRITWPDLQRWARNDLEAGRRVRAVT